MFLSNLCPNENKYSFMDWSLYLYKLLGNRHWSVGYHSSVCQSFWLSCSHDSAYTLRNKLASSRLQKQRHNGRSLHCSSRTFLCRPCVHFAESLLIYRSTLSDFKAMSTQNKSEMYETVEVNVKFHSSDKGSFEAGWHWFPQQCW